MLDISSDHLVIDNIEDVWLYSISRVRLTNGKMKIITEDKILVRNALQRRIDERSTIQDTIRQSVGKLMVDDTVWELWAKELTQPDGTVIEPKRPMFITPVNNVDHKWEILAVDHSTVKARYRVYTRK